MIDGYQKYLDCTRNHRDDTGIRSDIEKNLQETIEARDRLVSELRTMPPGLIFNCPDHTTLKAKNSVPRNATENPNINENDKKNLLRKEETPKITRKTLSFPVKPLALPPQRKYLNQSKSKIPTKI
ncbi:uncharacterized protein TNCV_762831 [Trichonephila clavipes]|nr:uncharacterized protein TNCV_762831 [Trichonephila clavipes]